VAKFLATPSLEDYMKLELYYYTQCPFCRIVLQHIEKLNLSEKIVLKNTLEQPESLAYHQEKTNRRTVPCLYIDDEPMFESSDICRWLEENKTTL
jgi:glutaredoxin 3